MDEINVCELPEKFYYVGEQGQFQTEMKENKKMQTTQYWNSKNQYIGTIMLLSGLVLILILLSETEVLNFFWQNLIALIGGIL